MADILVIQSKVRDQVKKAKLRLSGDAVEALSKAVGELIAKAGARAKANKRQTIKASDI
jgi:histone H3/H4